MLRTSLAASARCRPRYVTKKPRTPLSVESKLVDKSHHDNILILEAADRGSSQCRLRININKAIKARLGMQLPSSHHLAQRLCMRGCLSISSRTSIPPSSWGVEADAACVAILTPWISLCLIIVYRTAILVSLECSFFKRVVTFCVCVC